MYSQTPASRTSDSQNFVHPGELLSKDIEWRETGLDETLAETFPCSDPLSSIPNPPELPKST